MKNALRIVFIVGALSAAGGLAAKGGGGPGGHMSGPGQVNTNSQRLPDSDRGLDRAQQRMSDQGLAHQKATNKNNAKKDRITRTSRKAPKPGAPTSLDIPTPPGVPKPPAPLKPKL